MLRLKTIFRLIPLIIFDLVFFLVFLETYDFSLVIFTDYCLIAFMYASIQRTTVSSRRADCINRPEKNINSYFSHHKIA